MGSNKGFGGTLWVNQELWKKGTDGRYESIFLVTGPNRLANPKMIRAQQKLAEWIKPDNRFYQSAQKIIKGNKEWIAKQEGAVAQLEKTQAGAKGLKIVWAEEFFDTWKPVQAADKVSSCKNCYWKAFGPMDGSAKGKSLDWQVSVDGTDCQSGTFIGGNNPPIIRGGPIYTGHSNDCSKYLTGIGKHTIKIDLWSLTYVKGPIEILANGTIRQTEISQRVKSIVSGTMTCETKDDELQKQYAESNR